MVRPVRPLYKELPLSGNTQSSRFVQLIRSETATIHCKLYCYDLDKCPPYLALSYRWGPKDKTQTIYINGYKSEIQQSVWNFLIHTLQSDFSAFPDMTIDSHLFWIDAISIDQTDKLEKNFQVRFMTNIFQSASFVVAWLGEAAHDSDLAMRFLSTNLAKTNPTVDGGIHWDEITGRAILAIFEREYWSRIWIVQEFVLPERISIFCGANHFDGSYLLELLKVMRYEESRLPLPFSSRILQTFAFDLVNLRLFWSQDNSGFSLEYLLVAFREFQSSDERDKIYGLLPLAKETSGLQIDYNKSPLALYVDVMGCFFAEQLWGGMSALIRYKGWEDQSALSQILRKSLGLPGVDEKVQKATKRFLPYFDDTPFQMPSWYNRFKADYMRQVEKSTSRINEESSNRIGDRASKGFKDNLNKMLQESLGDSSRALQLNLAQGEQDRKLSDVLATKAKLDAREAWMAKAAESLPPLKVDYRDQAE